jgi:drug/metabolite transporter (DMT)-like permease
MIPVLFFLKEKRFFNIKIVKPLIYATIFIMIYNVFFFIGLKYGYSGLGGVLVTGSNPIFTFLIVAFLEKVKIPNIQKIALILGIIGTVITMDIIGLKASELLSGGNLLFLIASLMWSLVTIKSVEAKPYVNSLIFTLYLYISSSLVSFIFFVPVENIYAIFDYDYIFWINLIFTTAITSGFATTFYFVASNIIGASKASSFIFLVPVVALLSSAILMGEIPKLTTIIGGSILIIAVWLINKK